MVPCDLGTEFSSRQQETGIKDLQQATVWFSLFVKVLLVKVLASTMDPAQEHNFKPTDRKSVV